MYHQQRRKTTNTHTHTHQQYIHRFDAGLFFLCALCIETGPGKQLVTAVIVIYSTFAAIYYSKVNPLTSEYEYVDYFGRSFNGRSLSEAAASEENGGYLQRLLHGGWLGTAKHAMDFVLAAIEKVPQ
jgi:hypothetical protein